jgi:hypothetical protein
LIASAAPSAALIVSDPSPVLIVSSGNGASVA